MPYWYRSRSRPYWQIADPSSINHQIHRGKMFNLQTGTQKHLHMDVKKLHHIRCGASWAWELFGIVSNLINDMLLDTSSIDRFIRRIFPSELKFVPWNFHLVAILVSPNHCKSSIRTTAVVNTPPGDTPKPDIKVTETPTLICMAW